jgi:hypothetical protein
MSEPIAAIYKTTQHFLERWSEYFTDMDWEYEIKYSSTPGKKTKQKIKKQCPQNSYKMTNSDRYYYLISIEPLYLYALQMVQLLQYLHMKLECERKGFLASYKNDKPGLVASFLQPNTLILDVQVLIIDFK